MESTAEAVNAGERGKESSISISIISIICEGDLTIQSIQSRSLVSQKQEILCIQHLNMGVHVRGRGIADPPSGR
jgi:hypothetical protein